MSDQANASVFDQGNYDQSILKINYKHQYKRASYEPGFKEHAIIAEILPGLAM